MINIIKSNSLGIVRGGGIISYRSFSFGSFSNRNNVPFGGLKVLNDDCFQSMAGTMDHTHNKMEVIGYIIDGEVTHSDNLGNNQVNAPGTVGLMSCGSGIVHSERNLSSSENRYLQIWFTTDYDGVPTYQTITENLVNNEFNFVVGGDSSLQMHNFCEIQTGLFTENKEIVLEDDSNYFLYVLKGNFSFNGELLSEKDSIKFEKESSFIILSPNNCKLMLIKV